MEFVNEVTLNCFVVKLLNIVDAIFTDCLLRLCVISRVSLYIIYFVDLPRCFLAILPLKEVQREYSQYSSAITYETPLMNYFVTLHA